MEISFRFDESNRSITINVPVGGGFTIKVNPVVGLAPPSGGDDVGLNVYGLAPPSGGDGVGLNVYGLAPPSGGVGVGSNIYGAHVHHPQFVPSQIPKFSDAYMKIDNPKIFFDMTVDGKPAGRIVMELFADTTPRTAENFRALCTGEKGMGKLGKPLHYKGSIIHDVDLSDQTMAGGDFIDGTGTTGGESIYGDRYFEDENFIKKHDRPGILTMWNCVRNTNGSQFMICMTEVPEYDGDCVAFGQVVQGLDVITKIMEETGNKSCCGQI